MQVLRKVMMAVRECGWEAGRLPVAVAQSWLSWLSCIVLVVVGYCGCRGCRGCCDCFVCHHGSRCTYPASNSCHSPGAMWLIDSMLCCLRCLSMSSNHLVCGWPSFRLVELSVLLGDQLNDFLVHLSSGISVSCFRYRN